MPDRNPVDQGSGDHLRLKGQTAVVTGAANSIGRALARRLAAGGARLDLADIDGHDRSAAAAAAASARVPVLLARAWTARGVRPARPPTVPGSAVEATLRGMAGSDRAAVRATFAAITERPAREGASWTP